MSAPRIVILTFSLLLGFQLIGLSQEAKNLVGIGATFGAAYSITDVKGPKDGMYARLFGRYLPTQTFGFELGVTLGRLEATERGYFTSVIIPFDARFVFQPTGRHRFTPYLYAGAGLLYFDPVDELDRRLPRNAKGEYGYTASYFPLGGGLQYFLTENTAIELTAGYNPIISDNIDDIKRGGKDKFWNIGINLFAFLTAPNNDLDGDGLLNDEERQIGTDPRNPDTDGEGLRDGEEVRTYKTNPLNPDTDSDGLNDREEIFTYKTDPLNRDTDGDGLNDGEEVNTYATNPLNPDTDGDGLNDGEEVLTHRTNPLNPDTDGETLTDGDEVLRYRTNPLKPDTDGDELTDADELLKYKTNPLAMDTDEGGMPDGKEVQLGLNPLDPKDDVPIISVGERMVLEGVNFETAKSTLLPSARAVLDQVAQSLLSYRSAEVAIHGHTDNVGGARYNMNLSLTRADAVKAYLVSKGIDAARITTRGFGFVRPIADNATAAGKAKNRRIEFVRTK